MDPYVAEPGIDLPSWLKDHWAIVAQNIWFGTEPELNDLCKQNASQVISTESAFGKEQF